MTVVSMNSIVSIPVKPADVECIVVTTERTLVYGCRFGHNFVTNTPIDDIRTEFLRSCLFVDVRLGSHRPGGSSPEIRALINITQIQDLQMFDEGDAWITLKQGGDITDVILTEAQLQNLVRRAKLQLVQQERHWADGLGCFRLYQAPKPLRTRGRRQEGAPIVVATAPSSRQHVATMKRECPICSRTEPCASSRCGLK